MTVSDVLFTFKGRISRSEFFLKGMLPLMLLGVLNNLLFFSSWYRYIIKVQTLHQADLQQYYQLFFEEHIPICVICSILALFSFWCGLAVYVKRFHDRDRSGWFALVFLIPLVNIWPFIEAWFLRGTFGPNYYGDDPLDYEARLDMLARARQPYPESNAGFAGNANVARNAGGRMRLRGRDLHGHSYDIAFDDADFRRRGGRLVIGRNDDLSQLVVSHDSVSRQHAALTFTGGWIYVEDQHSGNGTSVNGCELRIGSPPTPLRPGDRLTLGEVELIFEILN